MALRNLAVFQDRLEARDLAAIVMRHLLQCQKTFNATVHANHQSDEGTHTAILLLGRLLGIVLCKLVGLQSLQFSALGLAVMP